MKCFVGLGSNLGERRKNLENAARSLAGVADAKLLRASPLVETPALVPKGAPKDWRKAFLNAVVEIEWLGTPRELLQCLKNIEDTYGRELAPRWAPRRIDLDLLTFADQSIDEKDLLVPHPEIWNRQFVLAPLKHLAPSLKIPGCPQTVLERCRVLDHPLPLWMGILNLTPDSFSDGKDLTDPEKLEIQLQAFDQENVQILDFGAESTRPGATPISATEEWRRLAPALERVCEKTRGQIFRPWISVDTYHCETVVKALAMGVDMINDVSGLMSPAMLELLQGSDCQYVLMHSLSIPADPNLKMEAESPVQGIKEWICAKLEQLSSVGVNLDRVIVDPGIGFGKTPEQSLQVLQQIHQILDLPVRVLTGHSRKSFLSHWGWRQAFERDAETLGVSLKLAEKGVDILRVHTPDTHQRTFRVFREV